MEKARAEASRLNGWESFRTAMFDCLCFLQKKSFYNTFYYIHHAILFLHTLARSCSNKYPWSTRIMTTWNDFLELVALPSRFDDEFVRVFMFSLVAALIVSSLSLFLYMTYLLATSTFNQLWLARSVRMTLGAVLTFQGPLLRSLMSLIFCADDGDAIATFCIDTSQSLLLFILALVLTVFCLFLVSVSTIMHINDPNSFSVGSKPHCRLDLAYMLVNFTQLLLYNVVPVIVFQPYYWSDMNNYKASLYAAVVWTNICFVAVSIVNDRTIDVVSVIYFGGLIPAFYLGHQLSSLVLGYLVRQGEMEEIDDDLLDEEIIFDIHDTYKDGVAINMLSAAKAAIQEVKTRFILRDRSPEAIARADCILKRGLIEHSQSFYLRVQYLTLVIAYRKDYELAYDLHYAFSQCPFEWDLRFSLFKHDKDYKRFLQGDVMASMTKLDAISLEEVKKTHVLARKNHTRAASLIDHLWKSLASGRTNLNGATVLIERIYTAEDAALRAFQYLCGRCPESKEILTDYATFLQEIKNDHELASVILDQAELLESKGKRKATEHDDELNASEKNSISQSGSHTADNTSSIMSSAVGWAHTKSKGMEQAEAVKQRRVDRLNNRMRFVSLLLLALLFGLLRLHFILSNGYISSLFNIAESGKRQHYAFGLAFYARSMHLAAIDGDSVRFATSKSKLLHFADQLLHFHTELTQYHKPTIPLSTDYGMSSEQFYQTFSIPFIDASSIHSTKSTSSIKFTGYDAPLLLIDAGFTIANATMSNIASITMNSKHTFPSFFIVIENGPALVRAFDYATTIYQLESEATALLITSALWIGSIMAFAIELLIVCLVFRPAVESVFKEFNEVVERFLQVPSMLAQMIVLQLQARTSQKLQMLANRKKDMKPRMTRSHSLLDALNESRKSKAGAAASSSQATTSTATETAPGMSTTKIDESVDEDSEAEASDMSDTPGTQHNDDDGHDNDNENDDEHEAGNNNNKSSSDEGVDEDDETNAKKALETADIESNNGEARNRRRQLFREQHDIQRLHDKDEPSLSSKMEEIETEEDFVDDDDESSTSRHRQVTLMYVGCLVVLGISLGIFATMIMLQINGSKSIASEINNSGRRRLATNYLVFYARELVIAANTSSLSISVIDSEYEHMNTIDKLKCIVQQTARGLLHVQRFLTGGRSAWNNLYVAQGWPSLTIGDKCLPFTDDPIAYNAAITMKGSAHIKGHHEHVYYRENCLTDLSLLMKDGGPAAMTRFQQLSSDFSPEKCILYKQGDSRVSAGFARIYEAQIQSALTFSTTEPSRIVSTQDDYQFLLRYASDSDDFSLGIEKSLMYYLYDGIQAALSSQRDAVIIVTAIILVVLAQYFVLGRRMERLLTQNISMGIIIRRLIAAKNEVEHIKKGKVAIR